MLKPIASAHRGDLFYAALVNAHEGLSPEESARLNIRLVFILANQIGDLATLQAALDEAAEKLRR
jgi:hypothetical protein